MFYGTGEGISGDEQDFNSASGSSQAKTSSNGKNRRRGKRQRPTQKHSKQMVNSREKEEPPSHPWTKIRVNGDIVFKYVLSSFKGSCTIGDLFNSKLFPDNTSCDEILSWLKNIKRFKIIPTSVDPHQCIVKTYDGRLRLCYKYPTDCQKEDCQYFHICRGFLLESCSRRTNPLCTLRHSFTAGNNKALLEKLHLTAFDDNQLRCILMNSCMRVCVAYNQRTCPNTGSKDGLICPHVHICGKFVRKECSNSQNCCLSHSLKRRESSILLNIYNMHTIQDATILKMLIAPAESGGQHKVLKPMPEKTKKEEPRKFDTVVKRETSSISLKENEQTPGQTWNTLNNRMLWLCESSLRNSCKAAMMTCANLHCELPYQWIAKQGDKWQPIRYNEEKEREFCDVYNPFDSAKMITMEDDNSGGYKEPIVNCINLRRLSTPSYWQDGKIEANSFQTVWIWYWQDNGNVWVQYAEGDRAPYQDILEASFHKYQRQIQNVPPEAASDCDLRYCYFETEEFHYRINFEKMVQENLKTGKVREIRRRPKFVSTVDVKAGNVPSKPKVHYMPGSANFKESPWYWVPMDTKAKPGLQKILMRPKVEHKRITDTFFTTMDRNRYEITEIVRLQNLTLWRNYDRKRKDMMKSESASLIGINEKQLFHGTPDEIAMRCITNQGFDPRMSGKHGTMYGLGAYFARDAEYSNNYTNRNAGIQYMFMARILVGKSCKGDAQTKRPPPLNAARPEGDLYDSCVNDERNPSIYVIFDRDQCYPELLIKYKEITAVIPPCEDFYPVSRPVSQPVSQPTKPVSRPAQGGARLRVLAHTPHIPIRSTSTTTSASKAPAPSRPLTGPTVSTSHFKSTSPATPVASTSSARPASRTPTNPYLSSSQGSPNAGQSSPTPPYTSTSSSGPVGTDRYVSTGHTSGRSRPAKANKDDKCIIL